MKRKVPVKFGAIEVGNASIDDRGKITISIDLETIDNRIAARMQRMLMNSSTSYISIDDELVQEEKT